MKISDQTPRDDRETIDTIAWSSGLDKIFVENLNNDSDLRYGDYMFLSFLQRVSVN